MRRGTLVVYPEKLQMLSLFLPEQDEGKFETGYDVRMIEIRDDTLITDLPLDERGYPKSALPGERVRVGYVVSGAFYMFDTTVVKVIPEQVPMLELVKPAKEAITRIQRRKYFRVPVMLSSVFYGIQPEDRIQNQKRLSPEEIFAARGEEGRIEVLLTDLSGGGFAFRHREKILQPRQMVVGRLDLPLNPLASVVFVAEVRRVVPEDTGMYLISLEFTDIHERMRDQILRYCMQRQLEMRKRLRG
jgi:c-di-GMP-binding flagellar brake protein YcgR